MAGKPRPSTSILDSMERIGNKSGRQTWRTEEGNLCQWDSLHGEVEVYNSRGRHVGVLDPVTGVRIKYAVPGRRIDV